MDVEARAPRTRRELAQALAEDCALRRRLVLHARFRFRLSPVEVEDVMQEALYDLMRQDGPVREPEGFAFRVVHQRCLQYLRYRSVRPEVPIQAVPAEVDVPTGQPSAEVGVLLREALAQVSPACRGLLRSHYLEGHSLKETAAALSYASVSVVWTLLDRCIRRLRALLGA